MSLSKAMADHPWLRLMGACACGAAIAAGTALAIAEGSDSGRAPDPPPHASQKQWTIDVRFQSGVGTVERARAISVDKAASTPRMMGRFALEFYIGREILDRLRFNAPLTADPVDPADHRPFRRPSFEKVSTRMTLTMADNPRATYLVFVDRATGAEQRYWWPPEADGRLLPMVKSSDAGASDAVPAPTPTPTPTATPSDAGHD
jgi:hypothetical protein